MKTNSASFRGPHKGVEEDRFVGEHNNLSYLRLFSKPEGDAVAPPLVERRNRIVEHDRRGLASAPQLSEESCQRDTSSLALAYHPGEFRPSRVFELHLVVKVTLLAADGSQLEFGGREPELLELAVEGRGEDIGDVCLG